MFKKLSFPVIIVSFLSTLYCARDFSILPDIEVPNRQLTSLEKQLAESGNTFSFKLFKEIVKERPDSNLFISPLSVSFALGMTYNGAAGATEDSMRNTLGFENLSKGQINETYQSLMTFLTGVDPKVQFQIANSIWYRLGFHVEQPFIDINQTYFDAKVRGLDFTTQEALDTINDWVYDKTYGKIEEVIDFIHPLTVMFLINAIYFKADWAVQFDPDLTRDEPFIRDDGSSVACKMMVQEEDIQYFETDDFQAVDLPYGNGQFSMTILLPKPDKRVNDLIGAFSPEDWTQWMASFSTEKVHLNMPRFKVEFEMKLNDVLKALGMGIAFSGAADFSNINRDAELFISLVLHKTYVEVDEEGTEAAAVTVVELREFSSGVTTMVLDRPFIYVIRERVSDTILFMGKMNCPEE